MLPSPTMLHSPLLAAASAAGYGREDFSSLGKIVRELGGV